MKNVFHLVLGAELEFSSVPSPGYIYRNGVDLMSHTDFGRVAHHCLMDGSSLKEIHVKC